jgi:murein L,D-transpeptidase YcbB/YkuD
MTKQNNLISIGEGIFVSEASLGKRKREAVKEFTDDAIRKEIASLGLEQKIAEIVPANKDQAFEIASQKARKYIESEVMWQIDRHIKDIVNQSIREILIKELSSAGLDREANIIVWQAIENMRKAAKIT